MNRVNSRLFSDSQNNIYVYRQKEPAKQKHNPSYNLLLITSLFNASFN